MSSPATRLSAAYRFPGPAVLPVRFRVAEHQLDVFGIVDSGAGRALLPKALAGRLGLSDSDLDVDPEMGGGVGSQFQTWSSTIPITGQVFFKLAGASHSFQGEQDGFQPFGSEFPVAPGFIEVNAPILLGRADFFAAFDLAFQHNGGHPVLHLSC